MLCSKITWAVSIPTLLLFFLFVSARAENVDALRTRLQQADDLTRLDDPALKPWHLKAMFQLYDDKGKPSEQGTIEEWWAGPKMRKRAFASPSYNATIINNADGEFRSKDSLTVPYLLDLIEKQLIHPMPDLREFTESVPDLRKVDMGAIHADCIMLDQPIKRLAYPPLAIFPTYCFDRATNSFLLSYDLGTQMIVRNKVGTFQQRQVSVDISIMESKINAAKVSITDLRTAPLTEDDFVAPSDYEKPSAAIQKLPTGKIRVSGAIIQGNLIKSTQPIYPASAKGNHTTGTVVLHAVIGTDGRIHSLRIVDAPDPDLAIASIDAVRKFIYRPYLLLGEPVAVDTTINVIFNIN